MKEVKELSDHWDNCSPQINCLICELIYKAAKKLKEHKNDKT